MRILPRALLPIQMRIQGNVNHAVHAVLAAQPVSQLHTTIRYVLLLELDDMADSGALSFIFEPGFG